MLINSVDELEMDFLKSLEVHCNYALDFRNGDKYIDLMNKYTADEIRERVHNFIVRRKDIFTVQQIALEAGLNKDTVRHVINRDINSNGKPYRFSDKSLKKLLPVLIKYGFC